MSKRKAQLRTFAEMLAAVPREPAPDPVTDEPARAGRRDDGTMADPAGRVYTCVRETVSATAALAAAAAGAVVVWDPCGCGGGCGFRWLGEAETARLVASGPPRIRCNKRRNGNISLWRSADGTVLLLAEDAVFWGDVLA
ncbi:hypothetical protein [Streptomyces sodiiphilus]|uniref:hypothetical protein n=1 Tax=Streptomyces sodiiphilus TaxID=226217 RepID=UPI0031DECC1F